MGERLLRQPTIGGDFAAEDRKERGFAGWSIELQNVVARCLLRLRRAVVVERPDAGIGPADFFARDWRGEILAGGTDQVVRLVVADLGRPRIAREILVGG